MDNRETHIKLVQDWLRFSRLQAEQYLNLRDRGLTHNESKNFVTGEEKSTVSI